MLFLHALYVSAQSTTQQYINQMSLCNYLLFFMHALYFSAPSSSTQQINQMSLCNYLLLFIHALYFSAPSSSTQQMSLCNYLIFFIHALYKCFCFSRFCSVIYTTIYKSNVTVITCFSSYMLCTFRFSLHLHNNI